METDHSHSKDEKALEPVSEFRNISCTPYLSKVLKNLVLEKLFPFFRVCGGYLPYNSTYTHLGGP